MMSDRSIVVWITWRNKWRKWKSLCLTCFIVSLTMTVIRSIIWSKLLKRYKIKSTVLEISLLVFKVLKKRKMLHIKNFLITICWTIVTRWVNRLIIQEIFWEIGNQLNSSFLLALIVEDIVMKNNFLMRPTLIKAKMNFTFKKLNLKVSGDSKSYFSFNLLWSEMEASFL